MGDYIVAYILIAVIGFVMLFCFLRMHEYLKQINDKMDKIVANLDKKTD